MTRRLLSAGLLAAALLLTAGCGGGDGAVDAGAPVTALTIRSDKTAFDVEAFAVNAGEEVTVTYENAHGGVQHNVHFKVDASGGGGQPETELVEGPNTQELSFTVEQPGEYDYVCDLHVAQMTGTLVVE